MRVLAHSTVYLTHFSSRLTANGLLWIAELIEEHSRTAKLVGMRAIYVRSALRCPASSEAAAVCHGHPCHPVGNGATPAPPHSNLDIVPFCLSPKLLLVVAHDISAFAGISTFLCRRPSRSLYVVLSFCAQDPAGPTHGPQPATSTRLTITSSGHTRSGRRPLSSPCAFGSFRSSSF